MAITFVVGAIALVLLGLLWQANKIVLNSEIQIFLVFDKGTLLL